MVKKRSSSKAWLKEHREDPFVQLAARDGYRSRACYKLLELDRRDHLLKPGMTVVDLGSAPGGWSQVAAERVGHHGRVIASDILAMEPIAGVEFVQGDFTEARVFEQLSAMLEESPPGLVMSDMAPNMSGLSAVDQPRAMYLAELALDLAVQLLAPAGGFVTKIFQGEGTDAWLVELRRHFSRVVTRKPEASRARSREVYVVGQGFRPGSGR